MGITGQSASGARRKQGSLAMALTHSSATEYALENQRVGGLQIRVAVICGLIQMCDGYDVGTIGWSVPSLTHAWQIAPSAFALAFLWSNIGLMAGALAAGPIGDRIGRKPLLLISLALFGLASLASALSPSLAFLAGTRFFYRVARRFHTTLCSGLSCDETGARSPVGAFSVKRLFWVCCQFFVRSGKAVLRPVACDQVRGARGRGQGTETLAELGGLPPSVACVSQRLEA
jgi:hypothetical protein